MVGNTGSVGATNGAAQARVKKTIDDKKTAPGTSKPAADIAPNGGESPTGKLGREQASPPLTFEVKNWKDAMRLFGINIDMTKADKDQNRALSDDEINEYFRSELGVKDFDIKDGLQWEEIDAAAKKNGTPLTKAYFDTVSRGGDSVSGDKTVTLADSQRFNERVVKYFAQGLGTSDAVVKKYMSIASFKMADPDALENEYRGSYYGKENIYAGDDVSAAKLFEFSVGPENQDMARIVLRNILGQDVIIDGKVNPDFKLNREQMKAFLMTMYFLAKTEDPDKLLGAKVNRKVQLDRDATDNGFLVWLSRGAKKPVEPKKDEKAGTAGAVNPDDPDAAQKILTGIQAVKTEVGEDGPDAIRARITKLDEYEKQIASVKNEGHKATIIEGLRNKRIKLAMQLSANENQAIKAMGIELFRKNWESDKGNTENRDTYLSLLIGKEGILAKMEASELAALQSEGLVKELEMTVAPNGVLANPKNKTEAQRKVLVVFQIAKIKSAQGEAPVTVQGYVDSMLEGVWDAPYWKGSEGDKAMLAHQVAAAKTKLFVKEKSGGGFEMADGVQIDRELKIIADNWKAKYKEGEKESPISGKMSNAYIAVNEAALVTADHAAAAYVCNRLWNDSKIIPVIQGFERENKDYKDPTFKNQQKAASSAYDKAFGKGGSTPAKPTRPAAGRATQPGAPKKTTPAAPPAAKPAYNKDDKKPGQKVEHTISGKTLTVIVDGRVKGRATQKDDGSWDWGKIPEPWRRPS